MAATLHLKQTSKPKLADRVSTLADESDASMDSDRTLITPQHNTYGLCLFLMLLERIQPKMTLKVYGVVVHSFTLLIQLVLMFFLERRVVLNARCPIDGEGRIVQICHLIVFYGLMTCRVRSCLSHLFGILSPKIIEKWPDHLAKYIKLSPWDKLAYVAIIVLPDFVVWLALLWIGSRYIMRTDSPEDMALRCVVMLFISRTDEVVYRLCTPTLISNAWNEWKVLRYQSLYVPEPSTKASLFQTTLFIFQLVLLLPWLVLAVVTAMVVCP